LPEVSLVRIDSNTRVSGVAGRSGARGASGADFVIGGAASPSRSSAIAMPAGVSGIEGLLALQAIGDPLERRRRKVRRGQGLLDQLESLRRDLLVGRVDPARLDAMLDILAEARDRDEPGLDSLLDDIELRVRVELAKHGRFPGF
jgi:hypothetical protein